MRLRDSLQLTDEQPLDQSRGTAKPIMTLRRRSSGEHPAREPERRSIPRAASALRLSTGQYDALAKRRHSNSVAVEAAAGATACAAAALAADRPGRDAAPERVRGKRPRAPPPLPSPSPSPSPSPPPPAPANALPALMHIGGYTVEVGGAIGTGGFSTVYAVTDTATRDKYALKVVRGDASVPSELRANLVTEVRLLESLVGAEHVIQLLAHNTILPTSDIHMLMELGQGDLRQVLARTGGTRPGNHARALDCDFVRYWGGQVLKAVEAVHSRNIVHADLKPANFVLVNGGLKLCDFGIANNIPEHTCGIRRNNAVGTLLYMAPETLQQTGVAAQYRISKASDMWGCGIILYEMVYHNYPYNQRTYLYRAEHAELDEVVHPKTTPANSPVPLALHEVIRDCLQLTPAARITAAAAASSVFFSPVSVDLPAIQSITRSAYKYGHHLGGLGQSASREKIAEFAGTLYGKLIQFNKGGNGRADTTRLSQ